MATKRTAPAPKENPIAAHVLVGRSNEEVQRRDAELRASGKLPRVQFVRDAEDKRIFDVDPDDEFNKSVWDEAIDKVQDKADKSFRFVSPTFARNLGGMRGYKKELDASGEEIRVGDSFVASIPKRIAEGRKRKSEKDALDQLGDSDARYKEHVAELAAKARDAGFDLAPLAGGTTGPGGDGHMGIEVVRGAEPGMAA